MRVDVNTYNKIRRLYVVEKYSQRRIARELGISRDTVARYCQGATFPGERRSAEPWKTPLQEVVEPLILRCLAANEQIAKKKERMDAKGIWRYLVEEKGIDIGQSTVRRLVARLKHKVPEAFIPLSFAPGEAMQIDWGDVTAVIGGAETPVSLFCAALPFSYAIFAAAFPNKSQESFFTGHVMAFEFFGGVPRRTIYDNLKTAVALGSGPTATKQQSFSLLEAHYAFEAVFCNAAAGWEKGGVENLVAVARAAVFVPRPQAASFQELQEVILNRCLAYRENHHVRDRKLSVREAFAEERQHLLPLPTTPFETAKVMTPKVGSDCTIRFGGTKYSVPWRFVGHTVTVRATPFAILAYHGGELIARHQRTYVRSNHQWNPDHYLELLERRPRAQENAAPLKHGQWPKEIETFRLLYRGSNLNEELVKLLRLARLAGPEALLQAVGLANQSQCPTYAQVVFQLQEMGALPTLCADPVVVEPTDLSLYDRLLKPGGMMMAVDEQILALGRRLRLPVIANYREYLPDTTQHPFPETLLHLLQTEVAGREERSFARRLKDCRFPELKTLDTFQSGLLPYLSTAQVQELATCNYIRNRNNVLGVGNSGTGKTHLCIALGIEAIRQGFSVRFHMVMPLLDQLVEARDNRELRQQMRPLESCDLLILDEFGYQRLSQPQASILFQLFASRHERRSTYVTTNLEFSKWADILNEAMLTAALVDRFAHKSILLNMNGPSYRLRAGRRATDKSKKPPETPS